VVCPVSKSLPPMVVCVDRRLDVRGLPSKLLDESNPETVIKNKDSKIEKDSKICYTNIKRMI